MKIFRKNVEIYDIRPEDSSQQRVVHMGDNVLSLTFCTVEPLDLRVNDTVVFENVTYKFKTLPNPTRKSRHEFEYVCRLYAPQYDLQDVVFVFEDETGVGVLDENIPIFGDAQFHLTQIVKCVKKVYPVWSVGDVTQTTEQMSVTYTDMDCLQALQHLAEQFKIEYWITGTSISLGKKKFGTPIPFKYGRGNALYELRRENQEGRIVTALRVRGSSRNIDSAKYKSKYLHLPGGEHFVYKNVDKFGILQDRISFPEVFPRLIHKKPTDPGSITEVRKSKTGFYFFKDAHLDFDPEALPDKKLVVDFQTGQLGGLKVEANYNPKTKEFELIQGDYGLGQNVPAGIFVPAVGDLYLLSDLRMPQAYIDAAERELLEKAQEAIAQVCEAKVAYKGPVNPLYFRTLGETIKTGRSVSVQDDAIVDGGGSVELRIQAYTRGVNDDLTLEIEISDTLYVSRIDKIENKLRDIKNDSDRRFDAGDAYTRRRFRDAKETYELLEKSQLNFSKAINPVAVQTMQLLVGDESLQFRFVNSKTNPVEVDHTMRYNNETRMFRAGGPEIIQHMTLGIKTLSPSHKDTEYKFWDISPIEELIPDPEARYVYLKCSATGTTGNYVLSKTSIKMDAVAGYYHFLAGILNSEFEGVRSFVPMYGFTEITPGQMRVNKIINTDGTQFWDMLSKRFRIGDANSYISYNVDSPNQLVLKGTLFQSPSGATDVPGIDRGNWVANTTYYPGDMVKFAGNVYKCTVQNYNTQPSNTAYWNLQVSKGEDGSYIKRIYKRDRWGPPRPQGVNPAGWFESPPDGRPPLWMSEAKFTASGEKLTDWSYPVKISGDGQGYLYAYFASDSLTPPATPTSQPGSVPFGWMNSPDFAGKRFIYITQCMNENGEWTPWTSPVLFSRLPEPGDPGPGIVLRGEWAQVPTPKQFYNNAARRDAVKFAGRWWIYKGVDGAAHNAFVYDFWELFGAQFSSVATDLLLAENANVGGWIFKNERLESQSGGAFLNGKTGEARLKGRFETGTEGNRIVIDPEDRAITMIDKNGREVCRLFFNTADPLSGAFQTLQVYRGGEMSTKVHLSPGGIIFQSLTAPQGEASFGLGGLKFFLDSLPTEPHWTLQRGQVWRDGDVLKIKTT